MKLSDAQDYPVENMSLVYSSKTNDVYQAVFLTESYGTFTRVNGRWLALSPQDTSLENLLIIDILPEDYKVVSELFNAAQKANRYLKYDEVREFEVGYSFDGSAEALLRDESDGYPLSKGFHAFGGCDATLLKPVGIRNSSGDLLLSITYKLISTPGATEIYNCRQLFQVNEERYVYLESGYSVYHGQEIDKEEVINQNQEGLILSGNIESILECFTLWLVEVDPIGFELLRRMNRDGFTKKLAINEGLTSYHDSEEPMDKWLNEMTDYAENIELSIEINSDNRGFMSELVNQVSNADFHTRDDLFERSSREDWVHPAKRMRADERAIGDKEEIEDLTAEEIEQLRREARERNKASEELKFSDVPPALQQLIRDLIEKVEDKMGEEEGELYSADLRGFIDGRYNYTQDQMSSQMANLLRLLM